MAWFLVPWFDDHERPVRNALVWLALLTAISLLQSVSLVPLLQGERTVALILFTSGAVGAWSGLPIVQWAAERAPAPRGAWGRFMATHFAAYVSSALLGKGVQLGLSRSIAWLCGVPLQLGTFWSEALYDVQISLLVYAALALLFCGFYSARAERQAALGLNLMERELADGRVQALALQLERARLATTLARVRAQLAHEPDAAEQALEELGDTLRAAYDEPVQRRPAQLRPAEASPPASWPVTPQLALTARGCLLALGWCLAVSVAAGGAIHVARPSEAAAYYARAGVRALVLWPLLLVPYAVVLRVPDPRLALRKWVAAQLAGLSLFVLLLSSAEYVLVLSVIRLHVGGVNVAEPSLAQAMIAELQYATDVYAAAVALWTARHLWEVARVAEERSAKLSTVLSRTRLAELGARVEPHFLYNVLNTIGELFYSDKPRASALLEDLGLSFQTVLDDPRITWSMGEELIQLRRYLSFVTARFGDRFTAHLPCRQDLSHLEVPRLLLQGLVENAVKHNQARLSPIVIDVRVRREDDQLVLDVEDDGVGFVGASLRPGGLSRLEQLLSLLYGPHAHVLWETAARAGASVRVTLPARPALPIAGAP